MNTRIKGLKHYAKVELKFMFHTQSERELRDYYSERWMGVIKKNIHALRLNVLKLKDPTHDQCVGCGLVRKD